MEKEQKTFQNRYSLKEPIIEFDVIAIRVSLILNKPLYVSSFSILKLSNSLFFLSNISTKHLIPFLPATTTILVFFCV